MTGMDTLEKTALDDTKSDAELLREKDAVMGNKYGDFLTKFGDKTPKWRNLVEWVELGATGVVKALRPYIKDHETRIKALEAAAAAMQAAQAKTLADSFRGTWQPGAVYERGALTVWDGSCWLSIEATETKPGSSEAWRLIVKRGKDGKDFRP